MKKTVTLKIKGLHKAFHGKPVLAGLDLELAQGELCVLIGRSGCGKSTLLRCLNGLETADSGKAEVAGRVGMVFQSFNLFPHFSVEGNLLAAPLIAHGHDEVEARSRAEALLRKVGLWAQRHHFPSQLSGGQQQRAAIARALAVGPEVMLYDEPTSSLDPHLRSEVLDVMLALKKDGMTQVVATHEHAFARKAADRVVFIEEGRVLEQGSPAQVFSRPRHARTKKFLAGLK